MVVGGLHAAFADAVNDPVDHFAGGLDVHLEVGDIGSAVAVKVKGLDEPLDRQGIGLFEIEAGAVAALGDGDALLLEAGHAAARFKRGERRGNTGCARADDNNIVVLLFFRGDDFVLRHGFFEIAFGKQFGNLVLYFFVVCHCNGGKRGGSNNAERRRGRPFEERTSGYLFHVFTPFLNWIFVKKYHGDPSLYRLLYRNCTKNQGLGVIYLIGRL